MYGTPDYAHYVLPDINDPLHWWASKVSLHRGMYRHTGGMLGGGLPTGGRMQAPRCISSDTFVSSDTFILRCIRFRHSIGQGVMKSKNYYKYRVIMSSSVSFRHFGRNSIELRQTFKCMSIEFCSEFIRISMELRWNFDGITSIHQFIRTSIHAPVYPSIYSSIHPFSEDSGKKNAAV